MHGSEEIQGYEKLKFGNSQRMDRGKYVLNVKYNMRLTYYMTISSALKVSCVLYAFIWKLRD